MLGRLQHWDMQGRLWKKKRGNAQEYFELWSHSCKHPLRNASYIMVYTHFIMRDQQIYLFENHGQEKPPKSLTTYCL